jgi:F-type H+-transporting ATPase subunit b
MEIIKTTALITINETLWVQLIGFLIFVFIINRVMFRPVRRNMADRDAHLAGLAEEIAGLQRELATLVTAARAEEQEIIQRAHREGESRRQAGRQAAEAVMTSTRVEIEARRNASREQLDAALATARREVAAESRKVAQEVMQQLLTPESVK